MSTPIQQLARRVLSPKAVVQNLFKSPKSSLFNSPSIGLQPPRLNNFKDSPCGQNCTSYDIDLGISPICKNQNKLDDVKIKINDQDIFCKSEDGKDSAIYKENNIIPFNTPERCKILNFGLIEKNLSVLGKGNFGTVVRGIYEDKLVAVKVVTTKNNSMLREVNALKLKHPYIVNTLKIISEPLKDFGIIFMENYPKSKSLQSLLDDSNITISTEKRLRWALEIIEGLHFCHNNDILHLDIKPKNVLVGNDEICRLCDFGNSIDLKSKYQMENLSLGTVGYTAPEIFKGKEFDYKADIYSIGITFWQMESRKLPYKNIDNKHTIIYEVVKHGLRPKISIDNDFSKLYAKCWAENPKCRPLADDIIKEIKKIIIVL